MEVQMTDFENAAFAAFVVLLSRAMLSFHINLYMPISKVTVKDIRGKNYETNNVFSQVDENMARAQVRNAAVEGKFYFRKNIQPYHSSPSSPVGGEKRNHFEKSKKMMNCFEPLPRPAERLNEGSVEDEYEEMTMNEIMNGKVRFGSFLQVPD